MGGLGCSLYPSQMLFFVGDYVAPTLQATSILSFFENLPVLPYR